MHVVDLIPVPLALLERLTRLKVDVARVLRTANVPRSRFEGARAHLTTREFFAFWSAVEEVGGVADVGLRLGGESLPHHYNLAFTAALNAATVGDALATLGRYKRLTCPEEVTVDVARGEARVVFHWLLADVDAPKALIDGAFAGLIALVRRGTSKPIAARRLELARRRPDTTTLETHFGCPIRFDAPVDAMVLAARDLEEPFPEHNAELLALLVPGLEAALNDGARARTLADDVRTVLGRRMSHERPVIEKVAKELGMSHRTLQRRLEGLGTTYQQLLDDVRKQSARRLLASTDLDAGEVAFLLGFQELNSFTRAFHAWEGTTPARWRVRNGDRAGKALL